jgi:hypothetical protein
MSESTDWRSMFDRDYIGAWDLPKGVDVPVVIERVKAGELTAPGGRKTRKPLVFFKGKEKGLALNKTNSKLIAGMYGNDTAKWVGKPIAIYATQTQFGGDTVECIRVRPTPPKRGQKAPVEQTQAPPVSHEREPGSDDVPADEDIREVG